MSAVFIECSKCLVAYPHGETHYCPAVLTVEEVEEIRSRHANRASGVSPDIAALCDTVESLRAQLAEASRDRGMPYPFRADLGFLHLPAKARVDHGYSLVELKPGDRVNCQLQSVGGREVYHVEIVRAWSYPHPSHEMSDKGCIGCGETKGSWDSSPVRPGRVSLSDSLRNAALDAPCANESCERCGILNGLASPACENHGELQEMPQGSDNG